MIAASTLAFSGPTTPHAAAAASASGNMNGKYSVASGDRQDVAFNDDYASKGHEYFDVWGPEIATHYAEVFWTDQGYNPLPEHIIKRFANKTMAITGYEMDQVMVRPVGHPGVNASADVSVPINWAYNHHYMMWVTGAGATMERVAADPDDVSAHGAPTKWQAVELPGASNSHGTPTSQWFSEGNGGESRKSFHGYPDGFAQLLHSPTQWHINPMQIDTRNRDCGATPDDIHRCVKFTPGPEPRQARYGFVAPSDTNYSGVLECPCNGRYGGDPAFYPAGSKAGSSTKLLNNTFVAIGGACDDHAAVNSALDCWAAAQVLGLNATKIVNKSAADPKAPHGCTVSIAGDTATALYNTAGAGGCTPAATRVGQATSIVNVTLALTLDTTAAAGAGVATIAITGPADVWFGVGLNATNMADAPYTLIANASGVFEQKIGTCGSEAEHCPGDRLATSVTLVSNTVVDGRRTIVVTRPFNGLTPKHYTFDASADAPATMNFLTAYGSSPVFAYHKAHHHATITLTNAGGAQFWRNSLRNSVRNYSDTPPPSSCRRLAHVRVRRGHRGLALRDRRHRLQLLRQELRAAGAGLPVRRPARPAQPDVQLAAVRRRAALLRPQAHHARRRPGGARWDASRTRRGRRGRRGRPHAPPPPHPAFLPLYRCGRSSSATT